VGLGAISLEDWPPRIYRACVLERNSSGRIRISSKRRKDHDSMPQELLFELNGARDPWMTRLCASGGEIITNSSTSLHKPKALAVINDRSAADERRRRRAPLPPPTQCHW